MSGAVARVFREAKEDIESAFRRAAQAHGRLTRSTADNLDRSVRSHLTHDAEVATRFRRIRPNSFVAEARPLDANLPTVYTASGGRRSWNRELNNPLPNTRYVVDGRFEYVTDDLGRVRSARSRLDATGGGGVRNEYRQRRAGGAYRQADDQGGHVFASLFGGPGEAINLTAMRKSLNATGQRQYYALEQSWRQAIDAGGSVEVSVTHAFTGSSLRPNAYIVEYTINGGRTIRVPLYN